MKRAFLPALLAGGIVGNGGGCPRLFFGRSGPIRRVGAFVLENDTGRVAHRGGTGRYRLDDNRVRANARLLANDKATQYLRACADNHAIFQRGVALLALVQPRTAQCHTLVDGAVITNDGGLADDDAETMVDEHPATQLGARVNFYARQQSGQMRDKARQPQPFQPPQAVRQSMDGHRMQSRVTGENLETAAGRRISLQNAGNVFAKSFEHIDENGFEGYPYSVNP